MRKKSKEDEQTLEELNSAHRRSKPKWQLVQTSYLERVKFFLFLPYNKHLINRAKSVCMGESWPRSCVQTSLRSVCTYDLGQDSPIQTSCSVNKSLIQIASTKLQGRDTILLLCWTVWHYLFGNVWCITLPHFINAFSDVTDKGMSRDTQKCLRPLKLVKQTSGWF